MYRQIRILLQKFEDVYQLSVCTFGYKEIEKEGYDEENANNQ